jgi:hypothetical protein
MPATPACPLVTDKVKMHDSPIMYNKGKRNQVGDLELQTEENADIQNCRSFTKIKKSASSCS